MPESPLDSWLEMEGNENPEDEAYKGEGCRPTSGNDAAISAGTKANSRPDTRNAQGATKPGRIVGNKKALLH